MTITGKNGITSRQRPSGIHRIARASPSLNSLPAVYRKCFNRESDSPMGFVLILSFMRLLVLGENIG